MSTSLRHPRGKLRAHAPLASVGLLPGIGRFLKDRDASIPGKLFVLSVIVYVFFPADMIPDVIPVVGWLDDIGLVGVALAYLARVSARYRGITE